MGDISGRPKTPSTQVVYATQPASGAAGSASTSTTTETTATPTAAEQREQSLLSRSRSRLGTILTGFRGILAPVESGSSRKTLLGE